MSESGDVRRATPAQPTYVHGDADGQAPRTTQETRTRVGRGRRGGGERSMVERDEPTSYYGRPVIKPPTWTWEIPVYFFTGGLAGASAALAYGAERVGNRTLARRAWSVSSAGIAVSPLLLTADLGKPERFINMLRVAKVTSPMSVGSWILSATGAVIAPAATYGLFGWPRAARRAQPFAAALGLPVATYTAVLISNTAVPVWSEARWHLPITFAAGSAASAGAAAVLFTDAEHAGPARRLAIGGALAEVAATQSMEHSLGELGEPYKKGAAGRLSRAALALTAVGGAMIAAGGKRSRPATLAGAGMVLAGAMCERWAIFRAGFQSAEDPKYTVGPQRARIS
jgi:hypothetical protein